METTQQSIPLAVATLGQGFPVLCLHGHPGSSRCLSVFTHSLSQKYFTIAPDLRGYGYSQVRQPFSMGDHLADLDRLLGQYPIDRCLILGWSLGGILALELALRYPERVSGLILVATAAKPRSHHPPITWQDSLYTAVAGLINWVYPGWQWNINVWGQRSLFRYLIRQHTPQTYRFLAREALPAYLRTSTRASQALNQALKQGYNRLADLDRIECPCLVLAGECDRHIISDASLETAHQLQNSDWICYPETAHLFPWEIPEQVCQDIDQWLQQHPEATQ